MFVEKKYGQVIPVCKTKNEQTKMNWTTKDYMLGW